MTRTYRYALLSLALVTACGERNSFRRDDPFSPTVRVGFPSYIWSYDLTATWNFYEAQFAHLVFEGLTMRDEGESLRPGLATSWEISADGLEYTFHLRPDVTFHDGSAFDARSVVEAWERALAEPADSITYPWMLDRISGARSYSAGESSSIAGLRIIDDLTLQVRLDQPYNQFLMLISLSRAAIGARQTADTIPIGTGPWRFVSGEAGQADEIWLGRHAGYWGNAPRLDSLVFRVLPDTALSDALLAGWIDVTWDLPLPLSREMIERDDLGFVLAPSQGVMRLVIDLKKPVFQDVRVRRALNHALDAQRGALVSGSLNAIPANGAIPSGIPGSDPSRRRFAYDPDLARRLLEEGGYPADRPLVIWVPEPAAVDYTIELGDFLRESYRELGLSVRIVADDERYDDVLRTGEADLRLEAWYGDFPDGEAFLYPMFYSSFALAAANDGSYANPEFDRLIERALREGNAITRLDLLQDADSVVYADAANVFLWYTRIGTAYATRLRGWTPAPHRTRFTSLILRDSLSLFGGSD